MTSAATSSGIAVPMVSASETPGGAGGERPLGGGEHVAPAATGPSYGQPKAVASVTSNRRAGGQGARRWPPSRRAPASAVRPALCAAVGVGHADDELQPVDPGRQRPLRAALR